MRSRAHYKAHPIHPSIVSFPFAFLTGALLFDALGYVLSRTTLWTTGAHLAIAGIAAGIVAAIPGAIDYVYSVPPRSSGKQRATRHAIGNASALVLFAVAWSLRHGDWSPSAGTLVLELAGAAALSYSGYLGGTLVTRNMISVDHRYANAGKWQEASVTGKAGEAIVVGREDDLEENQMKLLRVNGRRFVLARTADGYTAFDDACTHRGGALADGVLIDGTVQCLWHGSQFDVTTGEVASGPASRKIRVYEVRQSQNGDVVLVNPPK